MLIRRGPKGPQVLLGRRNPALVFMPGFFVFPGGRIGAEDHRPSGFAEAVALPDEGMDRRSRRLVRPLARAALRETYEETGLMLGQAEAAAPHRRSAQITGFWQRYSAAGLTPAFAALRPCARAITPTSEPRRFDTRFFVADGALAQGELGGSGELEALGWFSLEDARELPSADITQLVLIEAHARLNDEAAARRAVTLFTWQRGKRLRRPAKPRRPAKRRCPNA